jgi:hypothetical protein
MLLDSWNNSLSACLPPHLLKEEERGIEEGSSGWRPLIELV